MLPKIKNVLFATDLSANADFALRYGISLADGLGAKVHVIHVSEPLSQDAIVTLQLFMQDEKARTDAIRNRHAAVRSLLKENQERFVASLSEGERATYERVASVELVDGHPAEAILKRASDLDCDLIVMGAHEHGTGHTFLGTVTKRVMRRSRIPVLAVPYADD